MHINLEMVLEEAGTDFRPVVELVFKSRLEGVLDGEGEGPTKEAKVDEKGGREEEAEDEDDGPDDAAIEHSRSTNSTNESR